MQEAGERLEGGDQVHSPSPRLSLGAPPHQPAPPAPLALRDHPLPEDLGVRVAPGTERRNPDISPSLSPLPPVFAPVHLLPIFSQVPQIHQTAPLEIILPDLL